EEAVGVVRLEELQERVEHPANFTDVVGATPRAAERIELVEEVDAPRRLNRLEDEAQLGRRFTHVLGDEAIELDGKQRQTKLARQRCGGHRLARAWRPHEE